MSCSDPKPPLRAYFLRARVRAKQGDREGARRDQEEGFRGEPRDERDLTARGLARQPRDPQAALADYEAALKLNPRYRAALQNKANVLAENLGRTEEAIARTRPGARPLPELRAGPRRPGGVPRPARPSRGRARRRPRNTAEGFRSRSPSIRSRASTHSTSRQEPDDRREAFRLLGICPEPGSRPGPGRERSRSGRDPGPAGIPRAGRSGAGSRARESSARKTPGRRPAAPAGRKSRRGDRRRFFWRVGRRESATLRGGRSLAALAPLGWTSPQDMRF